jgi:hypothetical protein
MRGGFNLHSPYSLQTKNNVDLELAIIVFVGVVAVVLHAEA